ncbi:four-carbon acid sugar kinase family protein [Staphylococcus xylosus]|uniref:four-carbon acid sugar kinase family protein n=1 Tax=Staphylococcus xylosus TaxID=1288 RepID=UPI000345D552|nr:four-carbon acid sugar kinase family protein [Staphylococcus xylosus]
MLNERLINVTKQDVISKKLSTFKYKIIVLDDDPTGTQTVKDLPVYTEWSESLIEDGFKQENHMFYILTNSRALNEQETTQLHQEISRNIARVSQRLDHPYIVISRGDSTLRGHFYLEPKVLSEASDEQFDGVFYIPAFFEGKRYTLDGIHYLKEGNGYIPVSESEFANDTTFGFSSRTMASFIEEKSNGEINADDVKHIRLSQIRERDAQSINEVLNSISNFDAVIVDALNDEDMDYFVSCLTRFLESNDKKFMFRTAASFVKAMCETPGEIINLNHYSDQTNGGLMIVGSHVKKTSLQLQHLLKNTDIASIEFDVKAVTTNDLQTYINQQIEKVTSYIQSGRDVVVYTSRDVIKTEDLTNNLSISTNISNALVGIVQGLKVKPRFIIAKGGITSSDVATKGLNIKKALVIGQITQGVPVWLTGEEAKYSQMPYVIFPGNIGDEDTLTTVYKMNTKEI